MQAQVHNTTPTSMTPPLASALKRMQDDGITYAEVGKQANVNRSIISQYVNQGVRLKPEQEAALWDVVRKAEKDQASDEAAAAPRDWKDKLDIYPTAEYNVALGWLDNMRKWRKMGVLIGHPGSGKTTVLKRFMELAPGTVYIEAWPGMRMNDLLMQVGIAAGITPRGNNYTKAQQIIAALKARTDIMILIDEAEYLKKWDVEKFDILRKIWDNTGTPIVFCGTPELEAILTRGSGRDNLAQLYRRKYELQLAGVKAAEMREMLKDYNITPEAAELLISVAVDYKHGGMGNFAELLNLCLQTVGTSIIDEVTARSAMQYKLMY